MSNSTKESSLVTVSEAEISGNDFVRVLDGNTSRKITCTDFADVMNPLLVSLGFLTTVSSITSTVFQKVVTVSTTYNVSSADSVILCNTAGGVLGVNLPTAISSWDATQAVGQQFIIKRITGDLNRVTITPPGVETIDGNTAFDLVGPNLVSVSIVSDGANWHIIS